MHWEYANAYERHDQVRPEGSHRIHPSRLRQPFRKSIEQAAYQVLVHPENMRLRSLQRLINELELYSAHSILDDGHLYSKPRKLGLFRRAANSRRLNVVPYHSFFMFRYENIKLVPLDPRKELHGGQWYEHGALREWHERRRRMMWHPLEGFFHIIYDYEEQNQAVKPSYRPQPMTKAKRCEPVFLNECQHSTTFLARHSSTLTEQLWTTEEDTSLSLGLDLDTNNLETLKPRPSRKRQRSIDLVSDDTSAPRKRTVSYLAELTASDE